MSDTAKVSALERHVTRLLVLLDEREEELRVFKSKFKAAKWEPSLVLGLTPTEGEICAFLLVRKITSRAQLFAHLNSDDPEPLSLDFINNLIVELEKKLEPYGIGIVSFEDDSYRLSPKGKLDLLRWSAERQDAKLNQQQKKMETANG